MGVDCKGICVAEVIPSDSTIIPLVEKELRELIIRNQKSPKDPDTYFIECVKDYKISDGMYSFYFNLRGEKRKLTLFTDIHNEESDETQGNKIQGNKIRWSVGCWGSSIEIVTTVGYALKELGTNYIDYNDSDNKDYSLLEPELKTFYIKKHLR